MPLSAGTRLGPYEVGAAIGAGGMGEVYRARDTRLGRDVAIKILPAGLTEDLERRARFEREAQTVATLSHPNIVSLFDTGDHDGLLFVVMELLEGETLRDRLAQGAQPVRKTLDIGVQIARGLSAAHDKGLVHRDLKPANIFLLRDGQVKILDFGLARQAALSDASVTRTTDGLTDPGTVMGTVGYMAPEQVRGEGVDARTDLFAFGAVLYEMLSGKQAFQRDTAAEIMTAILREDPPDLGGTRSDLPPALDRIVRHCLEKNPIERFQTARDVAFALDALSGSGSGSAPFPSRAGSWPSTARWIGIAAAATFGVVAGAMGARTFEAAPEPIEFTAKTFDDGLISNARFMPDGRTIIYSASSSGTPVSLYELRDSTAAARRFGPDGTMLMAISKTGELAVRTGARQGQGSWNDVGTLSRMTLDAAPRPIAPEVSSADWSPDGKELAIVRRVGGLAQLEYPIGRVLYKSAGYISDIRVAPDGQRLVFMDHPTASDNRGWVRVVDLTGVVTTLGGEFPAEEGMAWSRDGRSVFFSVVDGEEPAFKVRRLETARAFGSAKALALAVPSYGSLKVLDTSASGSLLTLSNQGRAEVGVKLRGELGLRDLSWLDQSWGPSLSSDGSLLLFTHGHSGPSYSATLRRTDGSPIVELGDGGTMGISPNGRWAIAVVMATTPPQLVAYPTGAAAPIVLARGAIEAYDPDAGALWLPNNLAFLFRASEPGHPSRTYRQRVDGGDPRPVLPENVRAALVSRDGLLVAGIETGQPWRLYPMDGRSPTPLPGLMAGDQPVGWSEDGRAILIATNSVPTRLERVDMRSGARSLVREVRAAIRGTGRTILRDVTADGEQFAYTVRWGTTTLHVVTGVQGVK